MILPLPALIIKSSASLLVELIAPSIVRAPPPVAVVWLVSIVVVPAVLKVISAVLKLRASFFVEMSGLAAVIRIPLPLELASKVVPPAPESV